MKVRIKSDGVNHRVEDAETGKPIDGCAEAVILIKAGQPAKATLRMIDVEVDCVIEDGEAE